MRAFLWQNRLGLALGANAALLLAILLSINVRSGPSISGLSDLSAVNAAFGQIASIRSAPVPGGSPLVVMPGQLAPNVYGCYLLDPSRDSLCVYEYFHSDGLKLVAARNIAYDRQLQNFNTSPAPAEVKSLAASAPEAEH